jgi:hypothetical protein
MRAYPASWWQTTEETPGNATPVCGSGSGDGDGVMVMVMVMLMVLV